MISRKKIREIDFTKIFVIFRLFTYAGDKCQRLASDDEDKMVCL